MFCFCKGTVVNPPKPCAGCVQAKSIVIKCGQGLGPCGDTTSIDLKEYNTNSSSAVYSLRKYDHTAFDTVTVSSVGIVAIETAEYYAPNGLFEIEYNVVDNGLKNTGTIKVCVDNPCDAGCADCNWCDGTCYSKEDYTEESECGDTGTIDLKTVVDITPCDGTNTYTVTKVGTSFNTVVVSNIGVITYTMKNPSVTDVPQEIKYTVTCSKYGMDISGSVFVVVPNLCTGETWDDTEKCDPCTGDITDKTSDMGGTDSGLSGSGNYGLIVENN
jgi:hypothetical protein